jgi:hypothetical protein
MTDASTPAAPDDDAPLDPRHADPRVLMQTLLPAARRGYVKAWEFLADASTPLDRRRIARERAVAIAADHALVAQALRERESTLSGDDLLNARHLADELERHVDALERIGGMSPLGLQSAKDLRPESLGCGRRYRDPAKAPEPATRGGASAKPSAKGRGGRGDGGRPRQDRPFEDRGPKVSRDALGSSKHDSPIADDLDEATRAKLEALRAALED